MKTVTNLRNSLIGLGVATLSLGALAQSADEHKDHHPAESKPATVATQKASAGSNGADKIGAMDQHMKAMQAMHEKMAAAQTPEDRQALMAEHMKLMQDGMSMMKQMGGMGGMAGMGGMPAGKAQSASSMADRQQMMEKRMDMMQSMMQMMMDCMQMPAAK